MNIVTATIANLNEVTQLFDAYRVWYRKESDLAAGKKFIEERLTQKDSQMFLAKLDDGTAVGFTQCYPLFSSTRMQRTWLLNDLFVSPAHRGKGISKLLIDAAKNLARDTNAAGVLLETEKSNTIGNKLYPSVGFELEENNFYFWENKL